MGRRKPIAVTTFTHVGILISAVSQSTQRNDASPPARNADASSVSLFSHFSFGLAAGWTEVEVRVQPCSAVSAVHSNKVTRGRHLVGSRVTPAPPYGEGALGAHPDDEHHNPDDSAHKG